MAPPLPYFVQFVDQISATPTVRLDLATTWIVQPGSDLSPPTLQRAYAGSLLADGRPVTAAAYGNRTIQLELLLRDGVTDDAAAAAVQAIARELDRPGNFIRWQPGTSNPVFFRTLRAEFGRVYWDAVQKRCTVQIPAEPFAYGLKVTLSPATVNNNPAAGSNGLTFDIAGASVVGDVETPLFLKVTSSAAIVAAGRVVSLLAIRRTGTPTVVPYVQQIEAAGAYDADTTLQANSALMSGTGQNWTRTTFAVSASLATRAQWTAWPSSSSVDLRGTYRVLLRCRKSTTSGSIVVTVGPSNSSLGVNLPTVTVPDDKLRWLDMGLLQIPIGADPVTDGYGGASLAVGGLDWRIYAQRVSGTASLDLDALILVPADDRLALIKWPSATTATEFVIDGAGSRVYALGASGQVVGVQPVEIAGGLPMVSPGQAARVVWLLDAGTTSNAGDDVTASTVIQPYYWPRYLFVRGAV